MIITYKPTDGEPERVSTDELSALESAAVEEVLDGTPWDQVRDRILHKDPTALRAILWVVRRRTQKDLRFADFDIPGWERRTRAGLERGEIDDALTNILVQALQESEDSTVEAVTPHLRKLAIDPADVDAALIALGKGHLAKQRPASEV